MVAGSIMIYGCFSYNGVGNLVNIDAITNADSYIEIINENLEESVEKLNVASDYIFQQHNDPKHIAKTTLKFFKNSKIKLMD